MAKFIATIKAIITRVVFGTHGFIAIWQVTQFTKNPFYWYLSVPMLLLFFEGIFTLTIKENQEWKWFCPSVFLYLGSVVPAIWLLELDKVDKRLKMREDTFNLTASAGADLKDLHNLLGVQLKIPEIQLSTDMWVTLIEQFLMLILIIGRWMLPKGELTRDQLSQLLLVYIGTAADIIEFFDSFKDDKIASEPVLVILTLAIWSWSLMQFTVVLTATKSRKSRLSTSKTVANESGSCCNIDVWGIALNISLQDAPFLAFRLLIIIHFNIISYMNVFFTCKNSLVIMLQLYRLYVVYSENHRKKPKPPADFELTNISIISKGYPGESRRAGQRGRSGASRNAVADKGKVTARRFQEEASSEEEREERRPRTRKTQNSRKDTGYSTGSSHTSHAKNRASADEKRATRKQPSRESSREAKSKRQQFSEPESPEYRKAKPKRKSKEDTLSEEEESELEQEKKTKKKTQRDVEAAKGKNKGRKSHVTQSSNSDASSD